MILNKLSVGWRRYSRTIPPGYSSVAIIWHDDGKPAGLLVQSWADDKYYQCNDGAIRTDITIDQAAVRPMLRALYAEDRRKRGMVPVTVKVKPSEVDSLKAFMAALRIERGRKK